MKDYNITIKAVTFLLLISLFSCKPEKQGIDNKVRNLIESKFSSEHNPYIVDHIVYDTIGTGEWSSELATLMIDNPEWFSDKKLYDELFFVLNDIDTADYRMRLIANIHGHDHWGESDYYIGIIGDSLTKIEENPYRASIEALLNICSTEEKRVLDIANVIELSDRQISSYVNKTVLKLLSYWNSVHIISKTPPIFNAKGNTKDTTLYLQFTGINLNDRIDSVLLMHPKYQITKEFSFDNYSSYCVKNRIETKSGVHELETQLFTLDDYIVLIKAVCYDNIYEELYKMYKTKYGESVNVYSFDKTFCKPENGSDIYYWSFINNGIVLIKNSSRIDTYGPDVTYRSPKIMRTDYVFINTVIIYCDKQLYRKLVQKETERKNSVEREQFVIDSLKQVERRKEDSIQKAKEIERLRINASQI
ncbi:MAG: hypothetical protein II670_05045 [Alphaproteobacteria bacterium]|nr:hypothetical protein [Alphaproteobacteria bacterium]